MVQLPPSAVGSGQRKFDASTCPAKDSRVPTLSTAWGESPMATLMPPWNSAPQYKAFQNSRRDFGRVGLCLRFALTPALSPGEREERSRPCWHVYARLGQLLRRPSLGGFTCPLKCPDAVNACSSHKDAAEVPPLRGLSRRSAAKAEGEGSAFAAKRLQRDERGEGESQARLRVLKLLRNCRWELIFALFLTLILFPPSLRAASSPSPVQPNSDHWSFQPLTAPPVPAPRQQRWPKNEIDRFILGRLDAEHLQPAPAAESRTWLRRVCLDLTGLPPTPEQVAALRRNDTAAARSAVVEQLLASPRYGERWAQHWLDVVRYADTHGFEVNTERPNAWPYRDYVIRAFNRDTPYDQFIHEQLAGEQLGEDAATGFLLTASVLLPGQIGADEPSKRLARQDAIDEIVVNISQTFLGLSVGCARCHDHKFDPISTRDYYSMQAFVAGVEYEDRELRTPETAALRREADRLRTQLAAIDRQLGRFEPLARPAVQVQALPEPDSRLNEETFPPLAARFVRFTIHDANLHPTLGLIEPCLDEVEILTDENPPRNVALASLGTKASASGSRESGSHRLAHLNDGRVGNSRSWMSDEAGRGWVLFELPADTRIASVRWGRDREGKFTDRLPTAYTLEAGTALDHMVRLKHRPPARPAVNARLNTDRFAPVRAKRVRFTIRETNSLEPCIDELEVFDPAGANVALASTGTTVTSSGDTVVADRHELRQIHDGRYGNSRSWMSNEKGRGWVIVEFPVEHTVERVVWGRDREGQFSDRLATNYVIEVQAEGDTGAANWRMVADVSDRSGFGSAPRPAGFALAGLETADSTEATRLMRERKTLESQIKASETGRMAFAGKFRAPDRIRVLHRGDPEQPKDDVSPAIPAALGALQLKNELADPDRRRVLADWLANPANPLTARVMVNRIWQGHFGMGLVETPSDFGRSGARPSHPELLDWLATEFIRGGWSIKHLHRLIVLSATYGQSAQIEPSAAARDADVRLLWRYPSRRLEAESIRDAMLAVSGRLNTNMYGRGFDLFDQRGGLSGFKPVEVYQGDGLHRMIYAHKVRREREAVFGAFDCPDAGQSTARRRESTTPLQALNLFNSRFTLDTAEALASRVQLDSRSESKGDLAGSIRQTFLLALGRDPTRAELNDVEPVVRAHGLSALARVLFNSNEFLFLP